jgi:hypothetical protein
MNAHDRRLLSKLVYLIERDGIERLAKGLIEAITKIGFRGWFEELVHAQITGTPPISNEREPPASPDRDLKAQLEMDMNQRFPPWQRMRDDEPPDAA